MNKKFKNLEEFEKFEKEKEWKNLDKVEKKMLSLFRKGACKLHYIAIFPHAKFERFLDGSFNFEGYRFEVYIFFNTNNDLETCKQNGIGNLIKETIYTEMEQAGRGGRRTGNKI